MQALVLGTAQWGNAYGVTNSVGRLTDQEIADIAEIALESGIRFVDTASGYGDAEVRLAPWTQKFEITTKVKGSGSIPIQTQLAESLDRLQVVAVRCCLIHDWATLTDDEAKAAVRALEAAKAQGKVSKIGISGYDEHDLQRALAIFETVDAVQVPISVLDRRLVGLIAIEELATQRCEIQARSVFLQGLLAARSETKLAQHRDVRNFHSKCEEMNLNPIQVALSFIQEINWVNQVVVGITSAHELREILLSGTPISRDELASFRGSQDTNLIDPRNWTA